MGKNDEFLIKCEVKKKKKEGQEEGRMWEKFSKLQKKGENSHYLYHDALFK